MKEKVSFKRVISFGGAFIALIIGSGFATGQELMQYFSSYGKLGALSLVLVFALFYIVGTELITTGYEKHFENPNDIYTEVSGKYIGKFYDYFSVFFLFLSYTVMIVDFDCGTKQNAIPRMGDLIIATKESLDDKIESIMDKYKDIDGELEITYNETSANQAMSTIDSAVFSKYLLALPTGENSYMDSEKTILESSSNLAIVKNMDNYYEITVSVRSAKKERKEELENKLDLASKTHNVEYKYSEGYPTWVYREESELRNHAMDLYKKLYNKEMKAEIIHGGLECGVFYEKYRDLDMISIGPNISGAHTPKESLEIDSTERVYEFVKELLKSLK